MALDYASLTRVGPADAVLPSEAAPITAGASLTDLYARALGEEVFRSALVQAIQRQIEQSLGVPFFLGLSGVGPQESVGVSAALAKTAASAPIGPEPGGAEDALAALRVSEQTNRATANVLRDIKEANRVGTFEKLAPSALTILGGAAGLPFGLPEASFGANIGSAFGRLLAAAGY